MRSNVADQIKAQVDASYTAIADDFSETRQNPWEEFKFFITFVKDKARVLDLGCGNGRLYPAMAAKGVNYLGLDQNAALIALAQKQFPTAHFEQGDMTALALPGEIFDNVFCIAAFHHLPGHEARAKAAEAIHRVLKTDGVLVLTVWNLFQWKYLKHFAKAMGAFVLSGGARSAWNDLWIPWKDEPLKRYYHAFTANELLSYFPVSEWKLEEFYYSRQGRRVSWREGFNLCLILRKR